MTLFIIIIIIFFSFSFLLSCICFMFPPPLAHKHQSNLSHRTFRPPKRTATIAGPFRSGVVPASVPADLYRPVAPQHAGGSKRRRRGRRSAVPRRVPALVQPRPFVPASSSPRAQAAPYPHVASPYAAPEEARRAEVRAERAKRLGKGLFVPSSGPKSLGFRSRG
jgi:hypothetical protein